MRHSEVITKIDCSYDIRSLLVHHMLQKEILVNLVLKISFLFFFTTFVLGQLTSIQLEPGIFLYTHDIGLAVLAALILLQVFRGKKIITSKTIMKPFIAFVVIAFISLVVYLPSVPTSEIIRGSLYIFRFIFYSLLFVLAAQDTIPKYWWLHGLYVSGVAVAVLGIIQLMVFPGLKPIVGAGWDEHYGRIFSTLFDPNFVGMFFVLTLLVGLRYIVVIKQKGQVSLHLSFALLSQLIVLIALILTYSRSAYLAFGIGVLLFAKVFKLYKYIVLVLLFSMCIYFVVPKDGRDVNRLTRMASSFARVENWKESISLIQERPLLGYGFNLLRYWKSQNVIVDANGIVSRDAGGVNSSIFFVFITSGIVGGTVYLWWILNQIALYSTLKDKVFGTIGNASLVSSLVFSFFNHALFYPWILIWLMILLGIAIKMRNEEAFKKTTK